MFQSRFPHLSALTLAGAISAVSIPVFAGTVTTDGEDIVIRTKGGLQVKTKDDAFSFKLGGRLQADYSRFDGFYTHNGNTDDAAYLRRAFLELDGTVYHDWHYRISYDFSHNSGSESDGYIDETFIRYSGFSPIDIKVGRFDPPFGLEKATSSKWVTAPERTSAYEVADWVNSHQNGLGIAVSSVIGDMAFLTAGFSAKDADNDDGDSVKQFNLRGVYAPWHDAGNVLHMGLNYSYRNLEDTEFDARIRPRLGMRGISTNGGNDAGSNGHRATFGGFNSAPAGAFGDDSVWGIELAYARGPFSAQAEYLARKMKADDHQFHDIEAKGYYAQLAYTLTGEARAYKLNGARFDTIEPKNRYGAWEAFYRYDAITVDDDNLPATTTRDFGKTKAKTHMLGLNWYVNDAVKISAAYVRLKTDGIVNRAGDDDGNGFVTRLQYVF